jgi:hypothetical protein
MRRILSEFDRDDTGCEGPSYTPTPSRPINVGNVWGCAYCRGANEVSRMKCQHCGAPRRLDE